MNQQQSAPKHFVVHGIDGFPTWQRTCAGPRQSALLLKLRIYGLDPFQRMRDVGTPFPEEKTTDR